MNEILGIARASVTEENVFYQYNSFDFNKIPSSRLIPNKNQLIQKFD